MAKATLGNGYDNKNGLLTIEELLEYKKLSSEDYKNTINDLFKKGWRCPPKKYRTVECFFCVQCIGNAVSLVKKKDLKK